MNEFIIEKNSFLSKDILAFYNTDFFGSKDYSNNPNYLYKIKNDEVIVEQMICIFLLYAMVIFYMDATSVKLNRTNISEAAIIEWGSLVQPASIHLGCFNPDIGYSTPAIRK